MRSVSLSSYEPSAEKDVSFPKKKRDILAVCLAHLVVVWTVVPGLQWTVLHKWSLPTVRKQLISLLFDLSLFSMPVRNDAMIKASIRTNYQEETYFST